MDLQIISGHSVNLLGVIKLNSPKDNHLCPKHEYENYDVACLLEA